jgi:hypothetical protein
MVIKKTISKTMDVLINEVKRLNNLRESAPVDVTEEDAIKDAIIEINEAFHILDSIL